MTPRSRTGRQLATAAAAHGWTVTVTTAEGTTERTRLVVDAQQGRRRKALVAEPCQSEAIRLRHPDGRCAFAVLVTANGKSWAGDDAWLWGPRTQLTQTTPSALTDHLTQIEEENVDEEENPVGALAESARESFEEWWRVRRPSEDDDTAELVTESYVTGYLVATSHAMDKAGDQYGEGYAAGLAALTGHTTAWVKTRRRLDALRPDDVILGKGNRWWIVAELGTNVRGAQVAVVATSGASEVTVAGDKGRLVDVIEPLEVVGALDALKAEGITVSRETPAAETAA